MKSIRAFEKSREDLDLLRSGRSRPSYPWVKREDDWPHMGRTVNQHWAHSLRRMNVIAMVITFNTHSSNPGPTQLSPDHHSRALIHPHNHRQYRKCRTETSLQCLWLLCDKAFSCPPRILSVQGQTHKQSKHQQENTDGG